MRIWLAIRSLFAVLFNAQVAEQVRSVLDGAAAPAVPAAPALTRPEPPLEKPAPVVKAPARSQVRNDAITFLAALQRDARFLDIVQEPLDSYSDAQIGAAARDVLRNCATVIERLFAPQPALAQEEGSDVEVPSGYDPLRFRLVGTSSGNPPFRGKLTHHGWLATRCELPNFSGNQSSANIIAPIEVEI
jgi:hypothetical protein